MADQSNYSFHDLRQPLTAIMNFAGTGTRMIDNGADRRALKDIFIQIQSQAECLGELYKLMENSCKKDEVGPDQ